MKDRIRVNGTLYESANDNYLPERDDIIEDINDAIDNLKEIFREDLTSSAKSDKKLKKLFADATIALTDLKDYLRKNYTTVDRIG